MGPNTVWCRYGAWEVWSLENMKLENFLEAQNNIFLVAPAFLYVLF